MKPSVHARCEKTEAEANKAKAEAAEIAADAQKDIDEALHALEVAEKCLRALKLSHIQEVAALKKPPGPAEKKTS